jgi:hypothetical protein
MAATKEQLLALAKGHAKRGNHAAAKHLRERAAKMGGGHHRKGTSNPHKKRASHRKKGTHHRTGAVTTTVDKRSGKATTRRSGSRKGGGSSALAPRKHRAFPTHAQLRKMAKETNTRYIDMHTGKVYTASHFRKARNPSMGFMPIVVMFAGGLVGTGGACVIDRLIATRTPSGGKQPWYGWKAAQRIQARPDAMRIGGQFAWSAVGIAGALLTPKRFPKVGDFFVGWAGGAFLHVFTQVLVTIVYPMLSPVKNGDEPVLGNRVSPMEQDVPQTALQKSIDAQNKDAANDPDQNWTGNNLPATYLYSGGGTPLDLLSKPADATQPAPAGGLHGKPNAGSRTDTMTRLSSAEDVARRQKEIAERRARLEGAYGQPAAENKTGCCGNCAEGKPCGGHDPQAEMVKAAAEAEAQIDAAAQSSQPPEVGNGGQEQAPIPTEGDSSGAPGSTSPAQATNIPDTVCGCDACNSDMTSGLYPRHWSKNLARATSLPRLRALPAPRLSPYAGNQEVDFARSRRAS